jgi:hypothetical protein
MGKGPPGRIFSFYGTAPGEGMNVAFGLYRGFTPAVDFLSSFDRESIVGPSPREPSLRGPAL